MNFAVPHEVADLPGLERALDPKRMLLEFQRALPPRDGSQWERCAVERVSWKPGKSARILYRLWKEDEPAETGRPHFFYAEVLPPKRSLRRYLDLKERGGHPGPSGFVAELDMVYWRFPADPRLVQLPAMWREGTWSVVSYTPTMSCVLSGTYGGEPTIIKLYHDDRVERVAGVVEALRAAGVAAPRVLHPDAARRSLVLEHVPGAGFWADPARHLQRDVMAAMAKELAVLHDAPLPSAARAALETVPHGEREWQRFVEAREELATAFPILRPRLGRLETMLAGTYTAPAPALLHGDFHPAQFLTAGGRPRLIDYDNVCLGDPMYDLARFASHLFYKGMVYERPLAEIEAAVAAFRSGYIAAGTRFQAANWFWHLAVSLVAKRAHRVLTRLESGAEARVARLLQVAEQNAASIVRGG
jgi:aminoglycoside phosphotransferase (APT) family kinase protein